MKTKLKSLPCTVVFLLILVFCLATVDGIVSIFAHSMALWQRIVINLSLVVAYNFAFSGSLAKRQSQPKLSAPVTVIERIHEAPDQQRRDRLEQMEQQSRKLERENGLLFDEEGFLISAGLILDMLDARTKVCDRQASELVKLREELELSERQRSEMMVEHHQVARDMAEVLDQSKRAEQQWAKAYERLSKIQLEHVRHFPPRRGVAPGWNPLVCVDCHQHVGTEHTPQCQFYMTGIKDPPLVCSDCKQPVGEQHTSECRF